MPLPLSNISNTTKQPTFWLRFSNQNWKILIGTLIEGLSQVGIDLIWFQDQSGYTLFEFCVTLGRTFPMQ